jgi:hypothetical protein
MHYLDNTQLAQLVAIYAERRIGLHTPCTLATTSSLQSAFLTTLPKQSFTVKYNRQAAENRAVEKLLLAVLEMGLPATLVPTAEVSPQLCDPEGMFSVLIANQTHVCAIGAEDTGLDSPIVGYVGDFGVDCDHETLQGALAQIKQTFAV